MIYIVCYIGGCFTPILVLYAYIYISDFLERREQEKWMREELAKGNSLKPDSLWGE